MPFFKSNNIGVKGIVTCVPREISDNLKDENIPIAQAEKILDATGIRYRRITDSKTTASDLCFDAAETVLKKTVTNKEEVKILIFVTQTPDYVLPATATILQHKLGLLSDTIAFDINLGCSGYVYGLSVIAPLLEKMSDKDAKALLLVGDTITKLTNKKDLSTYPLFGDAGSATLLEKRENSSIAFDLYSDGSGAAAIEVTDGGFRNPYTALSEQEISIDDKNFRRKMDLYLNGMDVFSFGISKIPKAVKAFYEKQELKENDIDHFVFHQANKYMNEKIRKKLSLPEEKVPYTLYNFANVSCATIPLTITENLSGKIKKNETVLSCGFGVGLSWGIALFDLNGNTVLQTIEK